MHIKGIVPLHFNYGIIKYFKMLYIVIFILLFGLLFKTILLFSFVQWSWPEAKTLLSWVLSNPRMKR